MLKSKPVSGGISGNIFKIKSIHKTTEAVFAGHYFEDLKIEHASKQYLAYNNRLLIQFGFFS